MPPHLKKRKGRKNYYIADGDKLVTTGTPKKGLAIEVLNNYDRKRLGVWKIPNRRVSCFFSSYVAHCEKINAKSTLSDKQHTLELFKGHLGDPLIRSVDGEMVDGFLTWRNLSAERWNTERQTLARFFRFLKIEPNPCVEVVKKKIVRLKIPKSLNEDDLKTVLTWAKENDPEGWRACIVVANTGLRAQELSNLINTDVDLRYNRVHVTAKPDWKPKDYEERTIPLNSLAKAALAEQIMEIGLLSKWVFPRADGKCYGRAGMSVWIQRRVFKKAGLTGGLHRLRHTYATRMIESGADLETVRKLLGHSDLKTTMKYLHVSDKHVAAQVKKMGRVGK